MLLRFSRQSLMFIIPGLIIPFRDPAYLRDINIWSVRMPDLWKWESVEDNKFEGKSGKNKPDPSSRERAEREKLKLKCGWFQYLTVMSFFVSNTFTVPWRVAFDSVTQTYRVSSPGYQKTIWICLHFIGLAVTKFRILDAVSYVRTSKEDSFRYFDFASLLAIYVFDFSMMIIWWGKRDVFQDLLDELQRSPLLKVASSKSVKRTVFHATLFLLYICPVYFYFCLTWGMVDWNREEFQSALETSAEKIFNVDKSWNNSQFYPVLLILNLIINCHNSLILHFNDMIALSMSIFMFNISYDLRAGIKSGTFTDREVVELIDAQKLVTIKFNAAFGLACSFYSLYCSPYYAIHIIDMFNLPGFMNRYDTAVYILYLAVFLYACVGVNKMAKQRKRWLEANGRFQSISHQELALLLDDITWERFGIGSFFVINSTLAGEIVSLILTLAVITIQINARS